MTRALCLGLVFLSAGLGLAAQEPPAQPWLDPDVQDVVYLGDTRPVLFRLRLFIDGKPYNTYWDDYLKRLFNYLDRDENGVLDRTEVQRMPSAQHTLSQLTNPNAPLGPIGPNLREVDADGNGKVSFEEFCLYYRKMAITPVRLLTVPGADAVTRPVTARLFSLLDTNKDGKLSRGELEAADRVLRRLDQDDDELITLAELQAPDASGPYTRQALTPTIEVTPGMEQQPSAALPFLLMPREEPGERVARHLKAAREMLTRYDRNKDGKLSQDEIGFPKEQFARLGPRASGEIEVTQVLRWLLILPDVELTIHMGKSDKAQAPFELKPGDPKLGSVMPVQKVSPVAARTTLGRTSLDVIRMPNPANQVVVGFTRFYLDQFRLADPEKNGFISARQVQQPQFAYLKSLLDLADRDEDGKLTEKEVTEFGEVMNGFSDSLIALSYSDSGQGLFDLLDTNRDGRLSLRELRQAWNQLRQHDVDGNGQIGKDELPRQCQLAVTRGALYGYAYYGQQLRIAQAAAAPPPGPAAKPAAPLWFLKMDLNGDGDVSPREFLGTLEDFARIDTDGDGLISLEEAIKADQWLKDKAKIKP